MPTKPVMVPLDGATAGADSTSSSRRSDVSSPPGSQYKLSLHIHRETLEGRKVVDRLELVAVSDVGMLTTVFRKLLEKAFSGQLPDYMTSSEYYLFTPREEFLHHSGAHVFVSTQFRLVVEVDGWETVIVVRDLEDFMDLGDGRSGSSDRKMLIAMAQFDSDPVVLDDGVTEMQVSVEGYSVSVEKSFLDHACEMLLRDHESFYREQYNSDFPALLC